MKTPPPRPSPTPTPTRGAPRRICIYHDQEIDLWDDCPACLVEERKTKRLVVTVVGLVVVAATLVALWAVTYGHAFD